VNAPAESSSASAGQAAPAVFVAQEALQSPIRAVREGGHALLRPPERGVVFAVGAAQLGDLEEPVGACEVALADRDLLVEAP